jgi:thiol:disulfide interchange protein DsbC
MKIASQIRCACAIAALGLAISIASASTDTAVDNIRKNIHERFPDLKIQDVRPSLLPGWYEVFTGTQLAYSDATGDHLFVGKLIDTHTHADLAAEELDKRLTIDFDKLPFDRAIKIVKGDGSRKLALFEDPDCPFCQQLEHEIAGVTNVTLYVFLFPITELHPDSRNHAHAIWCAPDRGVAWTHWMLEHKYPDSSDCKDPIDQLQALGNDLNVTGTPTYFLASGKRLQGVLTASKLQELLSPRPDAAEAASNQTDSKASTSASQRTTSTRTPGSHGS